MAGRPVGSLSKGKQEFRKALLRYCADKSVDPFYWMVDLLTKKRVKNELKMLAARELAQYLQPKLKSIEITGDKEHPLHLIATLAVEQRQARIEALLQKREGLVFPLLAKRNGHEVDASVPVGE